MVQASSCSSDSAPSPGTYTCCRCGTKKKKKMPMWRWKENILPHLWAKHRSKCFTHMNSFSLHSHPMRWVQCRHSHFTDEETAVQRGEVAGRAELWSQAAWSQTASSKPGVWYKAYFAGHFWPITYFYKYLSLSVQLSPSHGSVSSCNRDCMAQKA